MSSRASGLGPHPLPSRTAGAGRHLVLPRLFRSRRQPFLSTPSVTDSTEGLCASSTRRLLA